jgi:cell fate regulator YaaT (PSP1 superfamily)
MSCGSCSSGGCSPAGCGSKGNCDTKGCNKLNTYDWLKDMVYPYHYKPFDVIEIRFKGSRKEFFRNSDNLELYTGDAVVLESDLGHDIGHVSLSGELVRLQLKKNGIDEDPQGLKKIYRVATEKDVAVYNEYKEKEPATLEKARTFAMQMKLEMKISDIEFQGDGKKVIFFYTSEGRVDFRELIKRYASEFKTRIEMRQVGYREEASRLGGIGSCGRVLCCTTWLTDYKMVNVSAAKSQNLSINMLKLSGQCGRLKCCLNYELDTYLEALSQFPRNEYIKIETQAGVATSQKSDILKKMVWFSYPHTSEWYPVPLARVNEIIKLNKEGVFPEFLTDRQEASVTIKTIGDEDIIGDDSLTRLDKPNKNKKGGNNRPNQGKFNKRDDNRNAPNKPVGETTENRPKVKIKLKKNKNSPNPNQNPNKTGPQNKGPKPQGPTTPKS